LKETGKVLQKDDQNHPGQKADSFQEAYPEKPVEE